MGVCTSKSPSGSSPTCEEFRAAEADPVPEKENTDRDERKQEESKHVKKSTLIPSPGHGLFGRKSPSRSPSKSSSNSTPRRFFKRPLVPPSPAKHIKAVLAKRQGSVKPNEASSASKVGVEHGDNPSSELDKNFGFSKDFRNRYELGEEMGQGHFGYTCSAKCKKGEHKGKRVAVKVIPKATMATTIAVEDVRREVKILRALAGHHDNLVQFYDACEDKNNVYIIMELCEGGELLDRILARGGKYEENEAKVIMRQILSTVAFCHLQGVVHRDLKPENFLFVSKEETSQLKVIDFGLSDFVRPEERLNDIVGSAYYVAPEVLHRAYGMEADVWSVGVIAYILLCGSRPFWARTESGIFKAVLKADPCFDEPPWPSLSSDAKDFVKRLLVKDPRRRMTSSQALHHPWMREGNGTQSVLDILVFKLMRVYMASPSLRRAALKAVSKTLTEDEILYMRAQFKMLEPSKGGSISLENIRTALGRNGTATMKEAGHLALIASMNALEFRRMDFEEFCGAALSVHHLETVDRWEEQARCAYDLFEEEGNRAIVIEELASELGLGPNLPVHAVLYDWIRHTDGKLSFHGFLKLLHAPRPPLQTQ